MKKLKLISFDHRINSIMTKATKGNSIRNLKSQLWIISPWLYMMCNKLFSWELLATTLTGIFISIVDFSFPDPIFRFTSPQARLTILVIVGAFAIHRVTFPHSYPRKMFSVGFVRAGLRAILSFPFLIRELIGNFTTMKAWFVNPLSGSCSAHQYEYNTLREVM